MTRPIRLLVVSHSLRGGGAERFTSTLVTAVDRSRFQPSVCLAQDRRSYSVPPDVSVRALGYRSVTSLPGTIRRLNKLMRQDPVDVVLSNVLSTNCITGGALVGLPDPPIWVARVGNAPEVGDPFFQGLWARYFYRKAWGVVSNSAQMREAVERHYPATAGRCYSIPNPTDFDYLERRAEEPCDLDSGGVPVVVAICRLTQQKRPDLVVRTMAQVLRKQRARLLILGDGPLKASVLRLASELGIENDMSILGFMENPFPIVKRADLVLMMSEFEGLPNALIEAHGLGIPVVATRCPYGPEEIVDDGNTGYLVPVDDVEAAAAAVTRLLAQPELLQQMGAAAADRVRRIYDTSTVVPQWEDLLSRAAAER